MPTVNNANGVAQQSPASRNARWVAIHSLNGTPPGFNTELLAVWNPRWGSRIVCAANPACAARRWALVLNGLAVPFVSSDVERNHDEIPGGRGSHKETKD